MRRTEGPWRRMSVRMALFGAVMTVLIGCAGAPTTDAGRRTDPVAPDVTASSAAPAVPSAVTPSERPASPAPAVPSTPSPPRPAPAEPSSTPPASPAVPSIAGAVQPAPDAVILPPSPPVGLSVPAIGVDASLIDLGRNPDGSIEVPSLDDPDSKPGWYENSPTPGTLGPAIILGHVDSRKFGPGVFFSLNQLKKGDSIDVSRKDGTVAIFTIDSVRSVQKSNFPTTEVYGNLDHAGLRLITCGGEFDENARSYESNIIVFATLVGSRPA